MDELQVAVWGLGPHAIKNILPAIASSPGIAVAGLCSRNVDVAASVARLYQCPSWSDPDDLLADRSIDVVYLSTPTGLHASQGSSVLAAGKHLWCEKPITTGSGEATSLMALSRSAGLAVAEAFMYLYHPHFTAVREVVLSEKVGRIETVTCRFGIPALDRPGFRNSPELGGGAFLDVGVYPISAMVALYPTIDPEVGFAEIITTSGSAVDTRGRAVLRYPDATDAVLEWRTGAGYRNEIDIWGVDGSVISERIFSKPASYVPELRFLDAHGVTRCEASEAANHFVLMFAAFRRLVDDHDLAEQERLRIEQRAQLVGAIRNHACVS